MTEYSVMSSCHFHRDFCPIFISMWYVGQHGQESQEFLLLFETRAVASKKISEKKFKKKTKQNKTKPLYLFFLPQQLKSLITFQ